MIVLLFAFFSLVKSTGPGKPSGKQKMSTWEDYLKQQAGEEECPDSKCPKEKPEPTPKIKANDL